MILFVAVTFMFSSAAMADEDARGRDRLAELMAFIRGSEECGDGAVPAQWMAEVLSVYVAAGKDAPTEDEIEAKVGYLDALKFKIGKLKWCVLYAVEMDGAHKMFQFMIRSDVQS